MTPLRFYDFMRAGHVKRWHIVNTVREQTVAEHSYLVTVIALELHRLMFPNETVYPQFILAAMFSDAPEVRYGDYPSPAKNHVRSIAGKDDLFQQLDKALMPETPYVGGVVDDDMHRRVIKMADVIEAAHWIAENKAGIHSDAVAKSNARILALHVADNTAETGVDWFAPVNAVLVELGMPYVPKAMMETPP